MLKIIAHFFPSQISIGRVLKAALVFKGIMIEWVTVKGFDENFEDVDDLWSESRYKVFRKVQDHTHSAMLHFFSPTLPELAVRSFLVRQNRTGVYTLGIGFLSEFCPIILIFFINPQTWLHSYVKLFSEPCKKCGNYLLNTYPPTWRDLRTLEPLHEECK